VANEEVNFGFGSVQFMKELEEVPASSKTHGNVTINNAGTPGKPEHFLVTFMLSCQDDDPVLDRENIFHWTVAVTGLPRNAPYADIEAEAARKLAPKLRKVSEAVEKMVQEFDAKAGS
jgi:hypothetical protein